MIRKLLNNKGNSLMIVMLAIAALSASTYKIMQELKTSKKTANNIQIKRNQEFLDFKIIALMSDRTICTENFIGKQPASSHNELKRDSKAFLEVDKTYTDGTIKITKIYTTYPIENSKNQLKLNIEYEKKITGSSQAQSIKKSYNLASELEDDGTIRYCFIDEEGNIEKAIKKSIDNNCNGPGATGVETTGTSGECTVVNYGNLHENGSLENECPKGQVVKSYSVDGDGRLVLTCAPLIDPIPDCTGLAGLKYDELNSKFQCFPLSQIISTKQSGPITKYSTCEVAKRDSKLALSCCICPKPSTFECGETTEATCGKPCDDQLGTGLNSSQCASPESVACGDRIEDKCGNFCGRGKKDCPEDDDGSGDDSSNGSSGNSTCPTNVPAACNNYKSFLPGTLISMADGSKLDVINVRIGDKVMTSAGVGTITKKYIYVTQANVYRMNTDNYFVTASHPFMTTQGWKSFDPESTRRKVPSIETNLLQIGDVLINEDGSYEILTNDDHLPGPHKVYNFSVDGVHDFFANGYWVHNK